MKTKDELQRKRKKEKKKKEKKDERKKRMKEGKAKKNLLLSTLMASGHSLEQSLTAEHHSAQ